MKGEDAAVDFAEWSEIRDIVGMSKNLEEFRLTTQLAGNTPDNGQDL
jgi:hypothetical protein